MKKHFCKKQQGVNAMNVIVCISENNGMLFNNRRQSRDKLLIENLESFIKDATLFISDFSSSLFENSEISLIAVSNPLECAKEGDFAFVEDMHIKEYLDKIENLILYKWNRDYPADFCLDISPKELGLKLKDSCDFQGNSHKKITREIWSF